MQWSWFLVVPIFLLASAWAAAALVYSVAPRRTVNRMLAVLLFLEGAGAGGGILFQGLFLDPVTTRAAGIATGVAFYPLLFLYPAFLGAALDTPLVRPFRSATARLVLVAAAVGVAALFAFSPRAIFALGRWATAITALAVAAFGLAASFDAWRRAARGSIARRRGIAFLAAFGTRDAGMVAYIAVNVAWLFAFGVFADENATFLVLAASFVLYYAFLAYGIVRSELFDVDVRLNWTVRQSTVAAVFAAVFVAVAATVEQWAGSMGVLWGGAAAAALVFALHPIQRFSARVADSVFPRPPDPGTLSRDERLAVYRDLLKDAWSDGTLSTDERRLLESARRRLDVSADDALRLEREVAGG